MEVSLHRLDDPVKGPRGNGETEGHELENKDPVIDLECKELVESPAHRHVEVGILEVRRTTP